MNNPPQLFNAQEIKRKITKHKKLFIFMLCIGLIQITIMFIMWWNSK